MLSMVVPIFFFLPSFIVRRTAAFEPSYEHAFALWILMGATFAVGNVRNRCLCYIYLAYFAASALAWHWFTVMLMKLPLMGVGCVFLYCLVLAYFAILLSFIHPLHPAVIYRKSLEALEADRHLEVAVRCCLCVCFLAAFMLGMTISFHLERTSLVFPMIPSAVAGVTMGPYVRRGYFLFLCYGVAVAWCWNTVTHTELSLLGFERFYPCYLLAASLAVLLPYLYLMRLILDENNVTFWPESCCLCALEKHGWCAYTGNGCCRCLDRSQRLKWRREEEERALAFLMSSHARLGANSAAGMLQGGGGPIEMILGFAEGLSQLSPIEWAVAAGKCALTQKGTPCTICLREGQLCQKYHAPR
jgi:hypothetical protein